MGLCHTGTNAAWIVGPLLGGFSYSAISPSTPFVAGAFAAVAAVALIVAFPPLTQAATATAVEGVRRNA